MAGGQAPYGLAAADKRAHDVDRQYAFNSLGAHLVDPGFGRANAGVRD